MGVRTREGRKHIEVQSYAQGMATKNPVGWDRILTGTEPDGSFERSPEVHAIHASYTAPAVGLRQNELDRSGRVQLSGVEDTRRLSVQRAAHATLDEERAQLGTT